jgi:hypothetical protein
MKTLIKKMLALLVITTCLQLPGYAAAPKHDHLFSTDCRDFKAKPPFTYWIVTNYESNIITPELYIEYKSFVVYYSTALPYNVTISYNLYQIYPDGSDSNDEYFATGLQGSRSTYLGYYQTYYNNSSTNEFSSIDLILNYVR